MRKLIWATGVVLALAAAENVRAIPVREVPVRVTGDETLSAAQVTQARSIIEKSLPVSTPATRKVTVTTPTVVPRATTTTSTTARTTTTTAERTATPPPPTRVSVSTSPMLLSTLIAEQNDRSITLVSRDGYTPESLISRVPPPPSPKKVPPTPISSTNATPAQVADGGATAGLLSIALLGTAVMKRKFAVA